MILFMSKLMQGLGIQTRLPDRPPSAAGNDQNLGSIDTWQRSLVTSVESSHLGQDFEYIGGLAQI